MKIKLLFFFIIIYSCKGPEDFKNLCKVPFIFTEKNKSTINFDLIVDNIFLPYCADCHKTEIFLSSTFWKRRGYLPLDDGIRDRLVLMNDLNFFEIFRKYINFEEPRKSTLIQVVQKAGVSRKPFSGTVEYKEPRFRCDIPEDVIDGMIWWIEKANGNIENLFN